MKKHLAAIISLALFVLTLVPTTLTQAQVFECEFEGGCIVYVYENAALSGSESGTKQFPYRTITEAVNFLKANATYNTIKIAAGTYNDETFPWSFSTLGRKVYIEGGYSATKNEGFSNAAANPSVNQVKIDGENVANQIFSFTKTAAVISGLDIANFFGDGQIYNLIHFKNTTPASPVTIDIKDSVFHDNDEFSKLVSVETEASDTAAVTLQNNVFHDNLEPDKLIAVYAGGPVTVKDNVLYNNFDVTDHLLYLSPEGSSSILVQGNVLRNNDELGPGVRALTAVSTATIKNNIFYQNTMDSILACGGDSLVFNNYMLGNTLQDDNASVVYAVENCTVAHNTIVGNNIFAGLALITMNGSTAHVVNNVIAHNLNNAVPVFFREMGSTAEFAYNALYNNPNTPMTLTDNNILCDPKLPNKDGVTANDMKLGSTSPCIDKGKTLGSVTTDYYGTFRPLDGDGSGSAMPDPGAHESPEVLPVPVISAVGVNPSTFSPNGDNVSDTTLLSFTLNTTAMVTVTVHNSANTEVRKLINNESKATGATSVLWDGKDANGSVVANNTYTLKVAVSNGSGSDNEQTTVVVNSAASGSGSGSDSGSDSGSGSGSGSESDSESGSKCAGYSDVAASHPDCIAIEYVKSIGAMTGNPDGTFAPNETLQRDQIAKISLEAFALFNPGVDYCGGTPAFTDVPQSQWSYQYICRGKQLGMITGFQAGVNAGKYVPSSSVNRVEFLALVLRNLTESMPPLSSTSYSDVLPNQWFSGFAKFAMMHGLFTGTQLHPTSTTSRLEVAEILYKLHQLDKL